MKTPFIMIALLSGAVGFAVPAAAEDTALNSLVTNEQLVALCAASIGNEAVPVELTIDNQTVAGTINCEQEYVDAAVAAVAAGQGALASSGDDIGDDSADVSDDSVSGDDTEAGDDSGVDVPDDSSDDNADDNSDDNSDEGSDSDEGGLD